MKHTLGGINFANLLQNFRRKKNFPKYLFGKQYCKICKTLCLQKFNIAESI